MISSGSQPMVLSRRMALVPLFMCFVTRSSTSPNISELSLKKHQASCLPWEIKALSIAAAAKHFAPFITQDLLTDSKPCVQAFNKLYCGQFSSSPWVTSFLSSVSHYQVTLLHLAGSMNLPSYFASCNALASNNPHCQVCSFVCDAEDLAACPISVHDGLLRRTYRQDPVAAIVPGLELTKIKDLKRYLNLVSISQDSLLIIKHD